MTNLQLFRRSVSAHPGLMVGIVFPLIVLSAMLENGSFDLAGFTVLSLIPWILILGTAWMQREQFAEADHG